MSHEITNNALNARKNSLEASAPAEISYPEIPRPRDHFPAKRAEVHLMISQQIVEVVEGIKSSVCGADQR